MSDVYVKVDGLSDSMLHLTMKTLMDNPLEAYTEALENVRVSDLLSLVRCKDCVHCEKKMTANILPFWYCLRNDCSVKDNDYCSWGEIKGGEDE